MGLRRRERRNLDLRQVLAPLSADSGNLGSCSCATSFGCCGAAAREPARVGGAHRGGRVRRRRAAAGARGGGAGAPAGGRRARSRPRRRRVARARAGVAGDAARARARRLLARSRRGRAVRACSMPLFWALEGDARHRLPVGGHRGPRGRVLRDAGRRVDAVARGSSSPRRWCKLEAWRTRRLLAPGAGRRVEWLTQTRAAALDASALELRRIERDLHDGAQAQLVALSLQLGMAEDLLDRDVEGARGLLLEARPEPTPRCPSCGPGPRHPPARAGRARTRAARWTRWRCVAGAGVGAEVRLARPLAGAARVGAVLQRRGAGDQRDPPQRRVADRR